MINENADRTVRSDMSMGLDRIVPEDWPYEHDYEGSDDMVGFKIVVVVINVNSLLYT